jgi:hypothetical protein
MPQINVTAFVNAHRDTMHTFSDSIARSGLTDIGHRTWTAAMAAMADDTAWLCSDLDAVESWFAGFGAWSRDELADMTGQELNALLVQFVAGDVQGFDDAEDRDELDEHMENEGGRLYRGDTDGFTAPEWFFYIGD